MPSRPCTSSFLLFLALCAMLAACASPPEVLVPESLGGESNVAALEAAEAGLLGKPTVVFFHATWCHICQKVRPEMTEMAAARGDVLALVQVDIDDLAARVAVDRYRVTATPTFVLLAADGSVLTAMPGWPGRERMERTIAQLLAAE